MPVVLGAVVGIVDVEVREVLAAVQGTAAAAPSAADMAMTRGTILAARRSAIHLISTNIWSWLSSFALSFPSAGTGTAAFFQRSRTLFGLPVTIRSDSEHVMVAALAPVLRRIAAVAPPLIFLYQQLAVCAPPSDFSWLAIGTPSVGKATVRQKITWRDGWGCRTHGCRADPG